MNLEPFDLEHIYDAEISPLMKRIIAICKEHGMQAVASFCYKIDDDGEDQEVHHCTTAVPGQSQTLTAAAQVIRQGVLPGQSVDIGPPVFSAFTVTTTTAEGGS